MGKIVAFSLLIVSLRIICLLTVWVFFLFFFLDFWDEVSYLEWACASLC